MATVVTSEMGATFALLNRAQKYFVVIYFRKICNPIRDSNFVKRDVGTARNL